MSNRSIPIILYCFSKATIHIAPFFHLFSALLNCLIASGFQQDSCDPKSHAFFISDDYNFISDWSPRVDCLFCALGLLFGYNVILFRY